MTRRSGWLWVALVWLLTAGPGWAGAYRAGLLGFYADWNPNRPERPVPKLKRVDVQIWFYQVPRDVRIGDYLFRRNSEFPWPAEVRQQVDLDSCLVLWTGFLFATQSGTYQFELLADEFAQLAIDEQPVATHENAFWHRQRGRWITSQPTRGQVELTKGFHPLSLIYGNYGTSSGLVMRWQPPGQEGLSPLPAHCLVHDPDADPTLREPEQLRGQDRVLGSGTGFVIHPDGYLVTCHHLVGSKGFPSVLIGDEEFPATVIESDPGTDLALLKIEKTGLQAVPIGNPDEAKRLEKILCFGYPLADVLGLELSAETGYITAFREVEGNRAIQINAAVNPGNSGGPLVNYRGEVLGVVNARLEMDGLARGVSFAVPILYARALWQAIPGFTPKGAADGPELTPAEVDEKISPAVLPILMRSQPLAAAKEPDEQRDG